MAHPALILAAALASQAPAAPFESEEGRFKVAMPSTPSESRQQIPMKIGQIDAHFFKVEKDGLTYVVSYSDYPPQVAQDDADKVLEGALKGAVGGFPASKIVRKQDRRIGQIPGKEVEFSFPGPVGAEGLGRMRLYLAGRRMYSILLSGPNEGVSASSDAFFRSFGIMSPVATSVARGAPPAATQPAMPRGRTANPGAPRPGTAAPAGRARTGMPGPAVKSATPAGVGAPFVSEAGGFRLAMPAKPVERTIKQPVPGAGQVEVHLFLAQESGVGYIVTYTGIPGGTMLSGAAADASLESLVTATVNGGKGTLVSKKTRSLGTSPGREFDYTSAGPGGAEIYSRSRAYVVGDKIYQLLVTGPKAQVAGAAGSAYFDSFTLLKP